MRLPPGRGGLHRRCRHPIGSWLVLTMALASPWTACAGIRPARGADAGAGPPARSLPAGAQPRAAADGADLPVVIQGPPPPEPPAVFARDAAGRMTIRAIRLTEPLDIDGTLDEPYYRDVPGMTGFVQVEPIEGAPATERTEVWLAFDDDNIYISGRCWDSAPESRWIANELRRDSFNIARNEYIDIVLDTFYDRRNGINLTVNPLGGRMDGQITDERDYSADWNPIWSVRAGRFRGGWTFESAIPFKSLRYRPGRTQVWGFSLTRQVRWKNELSSLVPLPISRGIMLISQAATVVGIEAPDDGGRVLEIKPYAIGDLTTDRAATPALSNALDAEVGLDVKYALTQNLVADATVNTDFAQVEVDEQQVNLTRFGLFYPEKREFFLENQGVFAFGGAAGNLFGNAGVNVPILFYSRRIGLEEHGGVAAEVPMEAGGRLTGRVGPFSVGALHIRTGNQPRTDTAATDFSVVRVKRDVLRRSSIGALAARRSVSRRGPGANDTYGVDGTFSFYDDLNINTYWARTATAGLRDELSYRAQLDYTGDRYGVQLERLVVGRGFNPEIGFLRRDDFEGSFGTLRFSPRPAAIEAIRQLTWEGQRRPHRGSRRPARDARADRALRHRVREQRRVRRLLYPQLRVPEGAVPDRAGGRAAGRRLRLPAGGGQLRPRPAAAVRGLARRRAGLVLRRGQDHRQPGPGTAGDHAAAVA